MEHPPFESSTKDMACQYIGCIGVKTSMRSLCIRSRSEVAKESINRLREAMGIKISDRKSQEHVASMLDEKPNLQYSGAGVELRVTPTHLNVVSKETGNILVQHEMPNVSFASSGDEEALDYVAYVANDNKFGRACFVLECGHGAAKSVLEIIARAFHLRTKQMLDKPGIARTRALLEKEPWYHGSYLSREESETRLKNNGDFLVRESLIEPGDFVLSVMHDGVKLHLLFDTMNQVRTKEMVFDNISHLVKYHHDEGTPIVAAKRVVYLRTGVRPPNHRT